MTTKETIKLMADIDSLLDIRQGILSKIIDEDKLLDLISSDKYVFRDMDEFDNVNKDEYNRINNNRTVDIISKSTVAFMFNIVKNKLVNIEKRNVYLNESKTTELIINIYPFKLTNKETEDIIDVIFTKLNINTFITIVNMSIKDLTPRFIKDSGIVSTFIYNSKDWLDTHMKELEANKLTDNVIYFPSIIYNKPSKDDLDKITKLGFNDIFSFTEYILSANVTINFLPMVFYSNILTASGYINKFNSINKDKKLNELFEENIVKEKEVP
ncbi:MAG: hypothetical protein ACD_33C00023G0006 [uncultured bacterium]|nr:MAG: hypothetical protein ACD_33C00023G0006 [uncultured bacterium]